MSQPYRYWVIVFAVAFGRAMAAEENSTSPISRIDGMLQIGSGLEGSAEGRKMLQYLFRCALPKDAKIAVPHEGGIDTLSGTIGLAPEWRDAALSPVAERWVSACLLSFVNALGEHIQISIRGQHPQLVASVTSEERDAYRYQEGAFYGNIFATPPTTYACRGAAGPTTSPVREKRLCTDLSANPPQTMCGFTFTGNCSDVCTREDEKDHYVTHCKGGDEVFDEVVTTFLPAK